MALLSALLAVLNSSILYLLLYHMLICCILPPLVEVCATIYPRQAMLPVWSHSSHVALEEKRRFFDSIAVIWCVKLLYNYWVLHNKKERTKSKFSCLIFSTLRKVSKALRVAFTIEWVIISVCKQFASFYCGYHEAAPEPYVQNATLNLPNPYMWSIAIILD